MQGTTWQVHANMRMHKNVIWHNKKKEKDEIVACFSFKQKNPWESEYLLASSIRYPSLTRSDILCSLSSKAFDFACAENKTCYSILIYLNTITKGNKYIQMIYDGPRKKH